MKAFIVGCFGFYRSLLTRYEEPDLPETTYYPDGERT